MENPNLIELEKDVNEASTALISITFKDETGTEVNPASAVYTLYDVASGTVINSRQNIDVPGDTTTRTIELTPDDNSILDDSMQLEEHRLYVSYQYGSGGSRTGNLEIRVNVINLAMES